MTMAYCKVIPLGKADSSLLGKADSCLLGKADSCLLGKADSGLMVQECKASKPVWLPCLSF